MSTIAAKVLELLTCGQNAFGDTDALSLKNRFLFALRDKSLSPAELCDRLRQDKTNVAHLAAGLIGDNLVEKSVLFADKRRVRYRLSTAGRERIERILEAAETRFRTLLGSDDLKADAEDKLDDVIRLFSFL
jgi:DNA-binding MarR family transcriptional regulator